MSGAPEEITRLLIKHLQSGLSVQERQELEAWMSLSATNKQIADAFLEKDLLSQQLMDVLSKQAVWQRLQQTVQAKQVKPVRMFPFLRWASAAAVVLFIALGAWFWLRTTHRQAVTAKHTVEITPGKAGAVLTLADGTQLVLDSAQNGVVAVQGNTQVLLENGQLAYHATDNDGQPAYNTMSTPRGRQFQLVLPDGTRVWLNAASSIRYPVAFTGKERSVEVTGEAFFEVATNANLPFRVIANNRAAIDVLGTSFNVNAYYDESSINTTLLEGSIRVGNSARNNQLSKLLAPEQQALMMPSGAITVRKANVNRVVAWKNGFFSFDNSSLEEVMRQLVRWYDIEVVYEKGIPDLRFGGEMSKDLQLSDLLQTLEESKVHFRLEAGRRLVVLP